MSTVKVNLELTPHMCEILSLALQFAQDMYAMRYEEATSGLLSPDPESAQIAAESLESTNEILSQLNTQIEGRLRP